MSEKTCRGGKERSERHSRMARESYVLLLISSPCVIVSAKSRQMSSLGTTESELTSTRRICSLRHAYSRRHKSTNCVFCWRPARVWHSSVCFRVPLLRMTDCDYFFLRCGKLSYFYHFFFLPFSFLLKRLRVIWNRFIYMRLLFFSVSETTIRQSPEYSRASPPLQEMVRQRQTYRRKREREKTS